MASPSFEPSTLFTNWVLGGSLVTLTPDKNKDSKKSKRANYKVLIVNEDGTTEVILISISSFLSLPVAANRSASESHVNIIAGN